MKNKYVKFLFSLAWAFVIIAFQTWFVSICFQLGFSLMFNIDLNIKGIMSIILGIAFFKRWFGDDAQ